MKESEYKACIDGLGLLEGEELKQHYFCFREILSKTWDGKPKTDRKKGLLTFTNDNLISMQQEGPLSSQALRIPLEQIIGMSCGGRFLKHISFEVAGKPHAYTFDIWKLCEENSDNLDDVQLITQKIQDLLNTVRAEKKRTAQEALAKGTLPAMIFCKFCGARNKADQSHCANCGAVLT
jgi:hypothetical protein